MEYCPTEHDWSLAGFAYDTSYSSAEMQRTFSEDSHFTSSSTLSSTARMERSPSGSSNLTSNTMYSDTDYFNSGDVYEGQDQPGGYADYPVHGDTDYTIHEDTDFQNTNEPITEPYQQYGPYTLFITIIGDVATAAQQASHSAMLARQAGQDLKASFITPKDIRRHVRKAGGGGRDMECERAAIRDILFGRLYEFFTDGNQPQINVTTMLQEAAYQLTVRVEGSEEEAYSICFCAIAVALAQIEAELRNPGSRNDQTSGNSYHSAHEKEKFACEHPDCKNKSFSRPADLDRHWNNVHREEDEKEKYICDYRKCSRHELPFNRQDHFRDHLRDQHREDLPPRGRKLDQKWWNSRNPKAIVEGWWRCNKCLVTRVHIKEHGYVCPNCANNCELERQRYRR